jgi:hypothetical protein
MAAGESGPVDAGESEPMQAGEPGPVDASEPGPVDAGESDLADTGESGPVGGDVADLREPGEDGPADASTEEPAAIADADRAEEVAAPTDATGPRDAGETEPAEPVGSDATADAGQEAEKAQSADVRDLPHSTDAVGPGREAEDTQPTSTAINISEAGEGEPVDAEPPEVGGLPEAAPWVPDTMSGDRRSVWTGRSLAAKRSRLGIQCSRYEEYGGHLL